MPSSAETRQITISVAAAGSDEPCKLLHNASPPTRVHIKGVGVWAGRRLLLSWQESSVGNKSRAGPAHPGGCAAGTPVGRSRLVLRRVELITTTSQEGPDFLVCDAGRGVEVVLPLGEQEALLVVNRFHHGAGPVSLGDLLGGGEEVLWSRGIRVPAGKMSWSKG